MIENQYQRLFVALAKLMTAEKMRLDRFCQIGEYLAYKIALPPATNLEDIKFTFYVELEARRYNFKNDDISERLFSKFESHLSRFLNILFERKQDFESRAEDWDDIVEKLQTQFTEEQRRILATHIDVKSSSVLNALGVITK